MINNFLNGLKFNKLSYLLETIELRNNKKKLIAYNKIRKMTLTKEMGLLILEKLENIKEDTNLGLNIRISLISLLFNNYYFEYSEKLYNLYPKLSYESKVELVKILSFTNIEEGVLLYKNIVSKYYKDFDTIPTGNLSFNKANYLYLFPDLYKALKLDTGMNNIIILLNDFVNSGVVPLEHIKKNKKLIQDNIIRIFKEGIKYKYKDEFFMNESEYIDLRIFLECAINLEYLVSNKETKNYIDKLFKKKDNQLKLFILDNYVRKNKDISKINLNSIAKDILSRYPLYSFLKFNKKENLMPKKYMNNKSLSESDLAINFSIFNSYSLKPYDFKLKEERIINNKKYFIYEFKTKYNYKEEITDAATDYILKTTKIDEVLTNNTETTYIGISGGYNKSKDPSVVELPLKELKVSILNGDYDEIISSLLPKEEVKEIEKKEDTLVKEKANEKEIEITDVEKKPTILRRIFSFNTLLTLTCLVTLSFVFILYLYINNVDVFNIMKDHKDFTKTTVKPAEIKKDRKEKFREIKYNEIFNRGEHDYYVLFFKHKLKSVYYPYINKMVNENYIIYYVDLSKKENKPIFENNETGFIINDDTFLRVIDGEYNFYIINKSNILKEFDLYMKVIDENEKLRKLEEEKKKKEQEKQAKLMKNVHEMVEAPQEMES